MPHRIASHRDGRDKGPRSRHLVPSPAERKPTVADDFDKYTVDSRYNPRLVGRSARPSSRSSSSVAHFPATRVHDVPISDHGIDRGRVSDDGLGEESSNRPRSSQRDSWFAGWNSRAEYIMGNRPPQEPTGLANGSIMPMFDDYVTNQAFGLSARIAAGRKRKAEKLTALREQEKAMVAAAAKKAQADAAARQAQAAAVKQANVAAAARKAAVAAKRVTAPPKPNPGKPAASRNGQMPSNAYNGQVKRKYSSSATPVVTSSSGGAGGAVSKSAQPQPPLKVLAKRVKARHDPIYAGWATDSVSSLDDLLHRAPSREPSEPRSISEWANDVGRYQEAGELSQAHQPALYIDHKAEGNISVSYQGYNGGLDEGVEIDHYGYRVHEYHADVSEVQGPIRTRTLLVEDHGDWNRRTLEANKLNPQQSKAFTRGDQGSSKRKASSPPPGDNGASAQPPGKSSRQGGDGSPHRSPRQDPPGGGSPGRSPGGHIPRESSPEEDDATLVALLSGFRPPLGHLVPPLRSIGITNTEYLVAVARMRNAASSDARQGYHEVRQAALGCGISVTDWAILMQSVLHALQVVQFPYP